jgi:hypothetical protein
MSSSELEFVLPDLRFVAVGNLMPHERSDPQRLQPLVKRIRENALLRNPPVVALLGGAGAEERFVLLDGANRAAAAAEAKLPHLVVQVVTYAPPAVELRTWYHALGAAERPEFEAAARAIAGLQVRREDAVHARAMLARREALACVAWADGAVTVLAGGRDLRARNELLNRVVDLYRGRQRFYRMSTDSLEVARSRYPEVTALVIFPHFEPAEVLELATGGALMPAGITRHLVRWRALRINIGLDQLADHEHTLAEKNAWLGEWLQEKLHLRQVRFYEEPTVLFDE